VAAHCSLARIPNIILWMSPCSAAQSACSWARRSARALSPTQFET